MTATTTDDWQDQAACVGLDPDMFFPVDAKASSAAPAKAVCATCPVIDDCRRAALARREKHGIWGGLTEQDRGCGSGRRRRSQGLTA